MKKEEQTNLIDTWIEYYTQEIELNDKNELVKKNKEDMFWAFEKLDEICLKTPDMCFEIILEILNIKPNDEIISNLAAGPLEDLLSRHGEYMISKVEDVSKINPAFKELLGGVWQNSMSEEIWNKVELCRGESW